MKLLGVRDPGGRRSRGKEKRREKENEKSRKRQIEWDRERNSNHHPTLPQPLWWQVSREGCWRKRRGRLLWWVVRKLFFMVLCNLHHSLCYLRVLLCKRNSQTQWLPVVMLEPQDRKAQCRAQTSGSVSCCQPPWETGSIQFICIWANKCFEMWSNVSR